MNETFDIPVLFNGTPLELQANLVILGYTHRIQVAVNGTEIYFEPDEERNYRAVIPYDNLAAESKTDVALLRAIAGAIEDIMK